MATIIDKKKIMGLQLLNHSILNKGTAFSNEEREELELEGFLPIGIDSEEQQVQRVKNQLKEIKNNLDKFIFLSQLQDINDTLPNCDGRSNDILTDHL